jgi:hypothetical protein
VVRSPASLALVAFEVIASFPSSLQVSHIASYLPFEGTEQDESYTRWFRSASNETLCWSKPVYGTGTAAGNEKGFVVAMTTCDFPKPARLAANEEFTIISNYDASRLVTGVMGLVYVAAAPVAT